MAFDLLIHGGRVLNPVSGTDREMDIAVEKGKIVALEPKIEAQASQTYDASGCLVCPGLIDFHTHVYWGGTWGVNPDLLGPRTGVTTFVDFGTAGPGNFDGFVHHVISRSSMRILAFLHIAYTGLEGAIFRPETLRIIGELEDIRRAIPKAAIEIGLRYPDVIRGIKARASVEATAGNGIQALLLAKQAAERLGKPLAVHIGEPPPTVKEIVPYLEQGDILTHCFRGPMNSLLDRHGKAIPEVLEARERGVVFDVGHGQGSFSFQTAIQLVNQGFLPDIISSDIHAYNIKGPVYDLPTTMSKFLAMGLAVGDIVRATTYTPAKTLGLSNEIGSLEPGRIADIAVLKLQTGVHRFQDAQGQIMQSKVRIVPVMTFKSGALVWTNGRLNKDQPEDGQGLVSKRTSKKGVSNAGHCY